MRPIGPTWSAPAWSEMPVSWLGVTSTGPVGSLAALRVGAAEVGSVGVVFSGLGRYMLCRAEESVAVASAPRPRTRVATSVPPPARRPIASPTPTRATSPATTGCCFRSGSGTVLGRPLGSAHGQGQVLCHCRRGILRREIARRPGGRPQAVRRRVPAARRTVHPAWHDDRGGRGPAPATPAGAAGRGRRGRAVLDPRPTRHRSPHSGVRRGSGRVVPARRAAGRARARARRRPGALAGRRPRDRRRGRARPRPADGPGARAVSLTAVGRSIDVGLAADPATCVSTSTALAALAETCERAALVLGRHAQLDEAAFGGLSGIVYRTSSTLLEQACGRTGRRSRRLAEGLAAYAQGMTEVRRRLDEAVALAAPFLDVTGGRIWSPLRPAGPDG